MPCVTLFLCFCSPLSIAITSLGEEIANLSAFRRFVRFAHVWLCLFPFSVLGGLRLVIMTLPGLAFYLFFTLTKNLNSLYSYFVTFWLCFAQSYIMTSFNI